MKYFFHILLIAQCAMGESDSSKFFYSQVMDIPDLSFLNRVYSGLDILEQMDFKPLRGKNIGILCNQTSVNHNGKHILDLLKPFEDIDVSVLFSPEYGLWGSDDKRIILNSGHEIDPVHGARIIDLFERYKVPPKWAISKLDYIIVDIQDTGVRYSTFMTSITKLMETASDHKVPVMILDRPNPIRANTFDGPIPRPEYQSFEAYHLVPIRHGLTIGEYAILVNENGWVRELKRVDLHIIPMANYKRNMSFGDTKLPWINPTPFLKDVESTLMYAGMDLFRGTNINVGFGTDKPYLRFGSPWLSNRYLKEQLDNLNMPGVSFKLLKYKPMGHEGKKKVPQYDQSFCSGIEIQITDPATCNPIIVGTSILLLIERIHPREFQWIGNGYVDKLYGSNFFRIFAAQKKPPSHLPSLWMHDILKFSTFRNTYLIYGNA
ncbi:MAG: DUF1343 domain-containing protein [Candidatus Marinimicrobia bacterium]|jgi:uncharacterized protein YbbC (DUF1343 family)|nr:DUF1343 domain-containing protein [Candidatus Neomarinimicrobiota bacterium]MBT3936116.1 DUF1343 domain-containing protein [Candidatus Neomarinimicrobiota bacterium]MBT3961087.1 DUF1343 domain-containing protein [Candidatus Neomarinimicrobiota bacterium]MBT4383013.1 DUF1343 domain-containing protein [Candidatus Neomarinimicrobiota bacterium]MBT4636491.1 DUF1343 domain-containing protein [Candidatus Neomarinimicrobiota bacterium]